MMEVFTLSSSFILSVLANWPVFWAVSVHVLFFFYCYAFGYTNITTQISSHCHTAVSTKLLLATPMTFTYSKKMSFPSSAFKN